MQRRKLILQVSVRFSALCVFEQEVKAILNPHIL